MDYEPEETREITTKSKYCCTRTQFFQVAAEADVDITKGKNHNIVPDLRTKVVVAAGSLYIYRSIHALFT
jgi:hypothetical protein